MPSGRSAASTSQIVPAAVWAEQIRVISAASRVATVIAWSLLTSGSPSSPVTGSATYEHVDVADVVELLGAALAQPDHGQPGLERVRPELGPGDGQGRLEGGVGQVGELVGDAVDRLDRFRRAEVPGGDPQQGPAVGDPERVAGDARPPPGPPPPGRPRPRSAWSRRSSAAGRRVSSPSSSAEMLGMGEQVLAELAAAAQHHDQLAGEDRRAGQPGEQVRHLPRPAGPVRSAPGRGRRPGQQVDQPAPGRRRSAPSAARIDSAARASTNPRRARLPHVVWIRTTPRCYARVTPGAAPRTWARRPRSAPQCAATPAGAARGRGLAPAPGPVGRLPRSARRTRRWRPEPPHAPGTSQPGSGRHVIQPQPPRRPGGGHVQDGGRTGPQAHRRSGPASAAASSGSWSTRTGTTATRTSCSPT